MPMNVDLVANKPRVRVANGGTGRVSIPGPVGPAGTGGTDVDVAGYITSGTSQSNLAVRNVIASATQTLTNKTISADNNTLSGIAASSFVLSNASGNLDGAAAQKAIPAGAVVGTTDAQTLTNKTLTAPALSAPTATGSLTGFGGAWSTFTPTVTAGSGTFTTVSASMRYEQVGKRVTFEGSVTITTVGTAGAALIITLPVSPRSFTAGLHIGSGRESSLNGKAVTVTLNSATTAAILNYDNTSPIVAGATVRISGAYEAA